MTVLWLCSEQAVVSCPHERVQCFIEVCALFLLVFVHLTVNLGRRQIELKG